MQEFLDGEEHCHNFINQDLTFLQPSTVYKMRASDDSLRVTEGNPSQEVANTSSFTLVTALSDDLVNTDYSHTQIQSVELLQYNQWSLS